MAAKFAITKTKNDQFMFNLKAANGQVILTSQMYPSMESLMLGIESVKENAGQDTRFERKQSSSGQPYFSLTESDGHIIGRSEMYSSTAAMEKGIASVAVNAPAASILDLTQEEFN